MDNFVLVASTILLYPGKIPSRTVADFRLKSKLWPLNEGTNHRLSIREGARLLIYLAGNDDLGQTVYAAAVAATGYETLWIKEPDGWYCPPSKYGIRIRSVQRLSTPVQIRPILSELSFVRSHRNKKWGAYFQGGCIKISDSDYELIRRKGEGK